MTEQSAHVNSLVRMCSPMKVPLRRRGLRSPSDGVAGQYVTIPRRACSYFELRELLSTLDGTRVGTPFLTGPHVAPHFAGDLW